jgi:hypothetical protein
VWAVKKGYKKFEEKSERYINPNDNNNLDKIIMCYLNNIDYKNEYTICPVSHMQSNYDCCDPVLLEYAYPSGAYIYV